MADRKHSAIVARDFSLLPVENPIAEAAAFIAQMAQELPHQAPSAERLTEAEEQISRTGTWQQSFAELEFGARVAWRNSTRCIGRVFWNSLKIFDARDAQSPKDIFDAVLAHIRWSTNEGALRPAITVFRPGEPHIRILNPQLILYAGYLKPDGSVIGDPKNVAMTNLAIKLGWRGQGGAFDVLPLILRIGEATPLLFELPAQDVLEVPIRHPEVGNFEALGLKWFALPAVSAMALDMGGVQYTAAPSSGVYLGTEIGSFNLGDPARYNVLPQVAEALYLDTSRDNALWRDQALIELNRAILHSFRADGVRIMDHHTLSDSFGRFRQREMRAGREVHGDWAWLVPPVSSNLSWIWHEDQMPNKILKPNYFWQDYPGSEAAMGCPFSRTEAREGTARLSLIPGEWHTTTTSTST